VGLAAQLAGMGRQAAADGAAPAAFLLLERALRLLCDANRKVCPGLCPLYPACPVALLPRPFSPFSSFSFGLPGTGDRRWAMEPDASHTTHITVFF